MLTLLSPAKSLDYSSALPDMPVTSLRFASQTDELARAAAKLKAEDLKKLMHISDALAELNVGRYANFFDQPERPAIMAFAGDVYIGFEASSLPEESLHFAQNHVRILSGLYGLLRPFDAIRPYRLEMGTRWAPNAKNLYHYWDGRIAALIADDMQALGTSILVNLASNEYWKAAKDHVPPHIHVIDIDFREEGPKGLRFNSFGAKRARGMMARYMCEHHLTNAESLKFFDSDGYSYDQKGSSESVWRFIRR
ncbi:MAG: peroxide stress protein YaaA [Alphaproteobacteria bacterium]|nr:peroxide stress protein YaaA [Alphaproteobacteria bacterium]